MKKDKSKYQIKFDEPPAIGYSMSYRRRTGFETLTLIGYRLVERVDAKGSYHLLLWMNSQGRLFCSGMNSVSVSPCDDEKADFILGGEDKRLRFSDEELTQTDDEYTISKTLLEYAEGKRPDIYYISVYVKHDGSRTMKLKVK